MTTVEEAAIVLKWQAERMERGVARTERQLKGFETVTRRAQQAVIALGGAFSVREIARYSDTFKNLTGQLKLVTDGSEGLAEAQQALFDIAQRSRTSFESVATLYARLARSTSTLGYETSQLQRVTETLSKATVVSGASSQEASNALIQLSQGLASGALRGDEFRSVAEQLPVILQILERELGKTRAELRKMAEEGEITAQVVVDAVTRASDEIDDAYSKIPQTIGQALTVLDNAFLNYIGNSEAVASGTNSVALAITSLANNFDDVADVIGLVASLMAGRYIAATGSAIAQTIAMRTAAVGLTGAMSGLGASMLAAFGGPVGLAVTALSGGLYYLATRTTEAEEAQQKHNTAMESAQRISVELERATGNRAEQLREERDALVQSAVDRINHTKALIEEAKALNTVNALTVARTGLSPEKVSAGRIEGLTEQLRLESQRLNELLDELHQPAESSSGGGSVIEKASKDAEKLAKALDDLQKQTSRDVYTQGMDELSAKLAEVDFLVADLTEKYGALNHQQREQIEVIKDNIQTHHELEQAAKDLEEQQKRNKELADEIGVAFGSAFEDAMSDAKDFGDVMDATLRQIERAIIRATITRPLNDAIAGAFGGGDILGSVGSVFSGFSLPSFDVGTSNVPKDMTANIHQGEMIIPKYDADQIRNGGLGGNKTNITVINNSGAQVETSSSTDANGNSNILIELDDTVAGLIAQNGTKTHRAVNAMGSRQLAKR
jgi:tape measure domain-containing protein